MDQGILYEVKKRGVLQNLLKSTVLCTDQEVGELVMIKHKAEIINGPAIHAYSVFCKAIEFCHKKLQYGEESLGISFDKILNGFVEYGRRVRRRSSLLSWGYTTNPDQWPKCDEQNPCACHPCRTFHEHDVAQKERTDKFFLMCASIVGLPVAVMIDAAQLNRQQPPPR
jgi:hypothetical protein